MKEELLNILRSRYPGIILNPDLKVFSLNIIEESIKIYEEKNKVPEASKNPSLLMKLIGKELEESIKKFFRFKEKPGFMLLVVFPPDYQFVRWISNAENKTKALEAMEGAFNEIKSRMN